MDPNPRAALERQQLRLRERQKFFEDILQPETEFVFPLSHLHLESQRRKFQVLRKNWGRLGKMFLWPSDLGGQLPSCFCGPINSEIVISQLSLIMLSNAAQSVLYFSRCTAPIGSISSMEVNVDTLEQVEFIDLADQDGADVFLPCEDSPPTPQRSGTSLCFALGTGVPFGQSWMFGPEMRL